MWVVFLKTFVYGLSIMLCIMYKYSFNYYYYYFIALIIISFISSFIKKLVPIEYRPEVPIARNPDAEYFLNYIFAVILYSAFSLITCRKVGFMSIVDVFDISLFVLTYLLSVFITQVLITLDISSSSVFTYIIILTMLAMILGGVEAGEKFLETCPAGAPLVDLTFLIAGSLTSGVMSLWVWRHVLRIFLPLVTSYILVAILVTYNMYFILLFLIPGIFSAISNSHLRPWLLFVTALVIYSQIPVPHMYKLPILLIAVTLIDIYRDFLKLKTKIRRGYLKVGP